jgi:hypothetical protein
MKDKTELEAMIQNWLEEIKPVPPRNPQAAARGRARFLAQAVSANEFQRHKGWISIFRKEQFAMNVLMSILIMAGLLFGGGATVNAAQDDLPNDPLYNVKMWSEDFSLQFQDEPETRVGRLMELVQIRVQEMTRLVETGEPVPDQVRLRLEQHVQQAIQACLTLDDPTLDRTLLQIRDHLRDQDRDMERLQIHLQDQLQLQTEDQLRLHTQDQLQLLTQTRTMLRERLRLVEEGLVDPEMFRERVRNGFHFGPEAEATPPAQNGNGQQNGQPSAVPGGPNNDAGGQNPDAGGSNTDPGGPNTDPGGPNNDSGGSNTDMGGPNTDPGGPHTDPGNQNPDPGGLNNDSGGTNPTSGGSNSEPGNDDTGGNNTGGNSPGGDGSGGNKP